MILAVSDTGPLIHLDEIDSLDLLSTVDELLIPQTVFDELDAGGLPPGLIELEYEIVEAESEPLAVELDPGETAAIAIASERSAVLLTDDLEAREAATDHDIEVHGSIGIIVLAYSHGELDKTEAAERMRSLQAETSLFITDAVVEKGISLLENSS
ncbi:nucleic acid-binding protein [Haloarchaeobius amylolyticus]|uniref:nucleic acid-binding protein n=1 Tax=Haloarchaeobius amylolyticus TaxID=1198296 RepID=UPI00226F822E|nr:nucleic acid-binding protein [Haloarchaeobius amylolyticus]